MYAVAIRLKAERIEKAKRLLINAKFWAKPYYFIKLIQAKNSF